MYPFLKEEHKEKVVKSVEKNIENYKNNENF